MGLCSSAMTEEELEAQRRDKRINAQLKDDLRSEMEIIKLLLLGAGESGKSTIFKQMKLLYGDEKTFSDDERARYRTVIHGNTISAMQTLIDFSGVFGEQKQVEGKAEPDLENWSDARDFKQLKDTLDPEGAKLLKSLWADSRIQTTYENRSKYQLPDSAKYYFDKVDELASPDFVPSDSDILRSRVRTSGIVEEKYNIDGVKFSMFDVGGQRNERKKWIHCFENVTAVIFVAALSAYDQVLYEDENTNRMVEAIDLFGKICNAQWFKDTSLILFLNKKDLFVDKIKITDPKDVVTANNERPWSDYDGGLDYDNGVDYFTAKFLEQNQTPETHGVTPHQTCATDTDAVKVVFDTCKAVILEENLQNAGFM